MSLSKTIIFNTTFSSYTSIDIIGEGGSGRVYKAKDTLNNLYAIKVLDPAKTSTEKLKRFKNELLFCQKNKHLHIITVLDHGILIDGERRSPFYVMPLYNSSLRTLLETKIASDKVLHYFGQILDGVEAAHLQKVTHRDLKPENILYNQETDQLVLADFGTARFEEEELHTLVETSPNTRLANFQYAAPEQRTRGATVDSRADIYALGLILNEMFTDKIPHGTGYKTVGSIASEYGYLDDLVTAMLHQSPEDRPATIEIVKQQLIGRKNEFITEQRLSSLKKTVVPTTDLDDELILDPPRLVRFDFNRGLLTLFFQRSINAKWIQALHNMGTYTSVVGKAPQNFTFSYDHASIDARESEIQLIIDYFKQWIPSANRVYEETLRREKLEAEEHKRQVLQKEIDEEEKRKRILSTIKI